MLITSTETCSGPRLDGGGEAVAGLSLRCFSRPPRVEVNCEARIVRGIVVVGFAIVGCARLARKDWIGSDCTDIGPGARRGRDVDVRQPQYMV